MFKDLRSLILNQIIKELINKMTEEWKSIKNNNGNSYNSCLGCGWRLADPDSCEGCINSNLYTHTNHQNDNEI